VPFAMEDPLKIFLGSLHAGIRKPDIADRLRELELPFVDVFVPEQAKDKHSWIGFVTTADAEQAINLVWALNDLRDEVLSATVVKAARTNVGTYNFCL
jgi:hypothetical protein